MNRQKGFTLIELLVVIAILGVIAAVVALNVNNFFGRGTLQAANTELRQVQTAIVAAMADGESNHLGGATWPVAWGGDYATVWVDAPGGVDGIYNPGIDYDAADYLAGHFRAIYYINENGYVVAATCNQTGQWQGIHFCDGAWQLEECGS